MSYKGYLYGQGFSHSTIKGYMRDLGYYESWALRYGVEVPYTSHKDLLSFIQRLKNQGTSQVTIYKYLNSLRHYFSYLQSIGQVAANPIDTIQLQGINKQAAYAILSPLELDAIYSKYTSKTPKTGNLSGYQRDKTILGLLVYQGITVGELLKLEVSHIKLRQGVVEVPYGRKSNGRTLKLEALQILDIQEYLLQTRKALLQNTNEDSQQLFISNTGSTSLRGTVYQFTSALKKRFPIVKDLHQIRASVIVKWLGQYNLRQVQYMAGHRYVSSTEKYQQSDLKGLQEDINKYHPINEN